jgi:hypothetical protein
MIPLVKSIIESKDWLPVDHANSSGLQYREDTRFGTLVMIRTHKDSQEFATVSIWEAIHLCKILMQAYNITPAEIKYTLPIKRATYEELDAIVDLIRDSVLKLLKHND